MKIKKYIKKTLPANFIKKFRKIILGYGAETYYFSQSGEEGILRGIFYKKLEDNENGFYVDVGAFHPTKFSNTYFFYLNGWNGINIDANPGSMKLFNKIRCRDINLNLAVANNKTILTYYIIENKPEMNTFSKEFLKKFGIYKLITNEIKIETYTLKEIFQKYLLKEKTIDFLNVDVEGLDLEVLKSNDWKLYRPKVVVVEVNFKYFDELTNNEIFILLKNNGYLFHARTILRGSVSNIFFIDNKQIL